MAPEAGQIREASVHLVWIPEVLAESVASDLGLCGPVEGEGDTLLLFDVLGLRGRRRVSLTPGTLH